MLLLNPALFVFDSCQYCNEAVSHVSLSARPIYFFARVYNAYVRQSLKLLNISCFMASRALFKARAMNKKAYYCLM